MIYLNWLPSSSRLSKHPRPRFNTHLNATEPQENQTNPKYPPSIHFNQRRLNCDPLESYHPIIRDSGYNLCTNCSESDSRHSSRRFSPPTTSNFVLRSANYRFSSMRRERRSWPKATPLVQWQMTGHYADFVVTPWFLRFREWSAKN